MRGFQENKCRLCPKVFCCKNCRDQHEENTHQINPECDICIYGKAILKNVSDNLMNHIKRKHWPLHCVICQRVFGSIEELIQHNKCPFRQQDSCKPPSTPVTPIAIEISCEPSPVTPITAVTSGEPSPVTPFPKNIATTNKNFRSISTSTPVQKDKYDTPNEASELKPLYKSSIKSKSFNDSKKKKSVTFSETPEDLERNFKSPPTLNSIKENEASSPTLYQTAIDWSTENSPIFAPDCSFLNKPVHLLSTVANAMKSAVYNMSLTKSIKRAQPEDDSISDELPIFKRRKFIDIKCRRTIRDLSPLRSIRYIRLRTSEKSTQTD